MPDIELKRRVKSRPLKAVRYSGSLYMMEGDKVIILYDAWTITGFHSLEEVLATRSGAEGIYEGDAVTITF